MRKILELHYCTECPMRLQAGPYAFYASCLKAGREITESDKMAHFPAWCPLPESGEKEEEGNAKG